MFCSKCGKEIPDDSEFCSKCGRSLTSIPAGPVGAPAAKKTSIAGTTIIGILLCVLLAMGLVSHLSHHTANGPAVSAAAQIPVPTLVPATQNFFTGQITVRPGGYVTNTFTVQPGMQNFHMVGHFDASGGLGNDIAAVLATGDDFQNWINGHQANVLYSTDKETTGHFDIGPLAPGQYVFAFSNKFSIFAEKQVFTQVDANWMMRR